MFTDFWLKITKNGIILYIIISLGEPQKNRMEILVGDCERIRCRRVNNC